MLNAILTYTSNSNAASLVGEKGVIDYNSRGGFRFTTDSGQVVSTSKACNILGDIDSPNTREFSFDTESKSTYIFECLDYERAVDGCFKQDNQFLGYTGPRFEN